MADITITTQDNQSVMVSESIQGMLLWDAAYDFRNAYTKLTQICHRLSENAGGPHSGTEYGGAASYPIPPNQSVGMRSFAQRAAGAAKELLDAAQRMDTFHQGEVGDTLIERSDLAPYVDDEGNYRKVFISNDTLRGGTTHIIEEKTGVCMYAGLNRWQEGATTKEQPFVAITTEDIYSRYEHDGEPIIAINLGDADLWDDMGEGNRLPAPVQKRTVRVYGAKQDPNNQDEGYNWTADVRFDWLKDEDGLPRMEIAHGDTEEECEKSIEHLIEMFQNAGQLKPGEFPKEEV